MLWAEMNTADVFIAKKSSSSCYCSMFCLDNKIHVYPIIFLASSCSSAIFWGVGVVSGMIKKGRFSVS